MKKFFSLIITTALVAVLAMPAFATDSRVVALAGTGNYIEDDYNIFNWPATLPSYSNTVWMSVHHYMFWPQWSEGDSEYFTMIGASYAFGEDGSYGTFGVFLYNYAPPLNMWGDEDGVQGVYDEILPSKFTFMYAYPVEAMTFGLFFSRADEYYSETMDSDTEEDSYAYTTIGVGFKYNGGENWYVDAAGDISFASYENQNTSWGTITDDANMKYGARARLFYEYNETFTFVPYLGFSMYDFRLTADSTDYADTHWGDKIINFTFGIGTQIKVNEDNMLIFVIEPIDYMKYEPSQAPDTVEYEWTYTTLPRFYLALESDVKDWLTFRIGGVKSLRKYTKKDNTDVEIEENEKTSAPFGLFMGLGFHIGDFDIDCVINNDLPYHMGYWLTGYPWNSYDGPYKGGYTNEPIYMVTGTYHF